MRVLEAGLASVSILWGVASILDPEIGLNPRLPNPAILLVLHVAMGLLLLIKRTATAGAASFFAVTAYYSLRVKPFAPLAEPQTVGLCAISLYLALNPRSLLGKLPRIRWAAHILPPLLLRGGVAYPFVEWGLDALRNPAHFKAYIAGNELAYLLAKPVGIEVSVFLVFLTECVLALLILAGVWRRALGIVSASLLSMFLVVAGYPLAFPQNLGLVAASLCIFKGSAGRASVSA